MLYEQLEQEVFDGGFWLQEIAMPDDIEGMLVADTICINSRMESRYQKNRVLCHELKHGETCPHNLLTTPKLLQNKFETIATRATIKKLVPIDALIFLYESGAREPWEFSDALEVDEAFFVSALKTYHSIYGYHYRYKGRILSFSPFTIHRKENRV